MTRLGALGERLRHVHARLVRVPAPAIARQRQRIEQLQARLHRAAALERIALLRKRAEHARLRLQAVCARGLEHRATHLAGLARSLNALSPLATLERGYAIAFDAAGRTVQSVEAIKPDDTLRIKVRDGEIDARVVAARLQSG